ncbi:MAG: dipeptide epimerase [Deltaproteobacteria bacterium]|nr:dipeptide epimerase [Deltaproteobacteria bacterium]
MIIRKVDIWRLHLPFLSPIKHNLATHTSSANLVVKVTADTPRPGYGEGVPRDFVTGETISASLAFLVETLIPALLGQEFSSPPQLQTALRDLFLTTAGGRCPAAFCALETAVLDAAGRAWDLPLSEFFGTRRRGSLIYSAVIPMAPREQLARLLGLVQTMAMPFVKLKVGGPDDLEVLKLARETLGWQVDIRADANCAWTATEAIRRLRELAPYRLSAVEQPVAKDDLEGLQEVGAATGLPVIADESLCNENDARRLIDLKACGIFNLRLSKCGGPGAAGRIRRLAAAAGVRCQLGCHVGETSILSAAGRHFASCGPDLVYLEGSFSPFLFARELVAQPVVFGPGGLASDLTGPGLGIEVLDQALSDFAVSHQQLNA